MALDYQRLLAWKVREVEQQYTDTDILLYGLGLGLGLQPDDPHQVRFVYEEGLRVLPTVATVLGYPGFWLKDPQTGIDWKQILHGEQGLVVHRPFGPSGHVVGRTQVDAIVDKGAGKGALLYSSRKIYDQRSGELACVLTSTHVLRAEGGFGGPSGPIPPPVVMPEGPAELFHDHHTSPQSALIYRLCGDRNPLHADPAVARTAGFRQPILHGLASFGIAGYNVVKHFCAGDPSRLRSIKVRFSSPVYPGEALRTEMWRSGANRCFFRCRVLERDVIVLNNGLAEFDS